MSETGTDRLDRYLARRGDPAILAPGLRLPPPDGGFVPTWERWQARAAEEGAWAVLRRHLPQLCFPIREGSRSDPAYRAATLRGILPANDETPGALRLVDPESLEILLHRGISGTIPVILVHRREDFVTLLQALAYRNEPRPIPPGQGAAMIAGYVNWFRIRQLRDAWLGKARDGDRWEDEWRRILPLKDLYQDRFLLLSDGPYGGVSATELGLPKARWRLWSSRIRLEHECCHHLMKTVFGSIENHLHDEIVADLVGMTAVLGHFRADWFQRFLGPPGDDSRIELYRGDPPLCDADWRYCHELVCRAAENLESLSRAFPFAAEDLARRAASLVALASLTLPEMAASGLPERFEASLESVEARIFAPG